MKPTELEALKARHRPSLMDTSKCDTYDCGLWPCPTAHLIADLERAWALLRGLVIARRGPSAKVWDEATAYLRKARLNERLGAK